MGIVAIVATAIFCLNRSNTNLDDMTAESGIDKALQYRDALLAAYNSDTGDMSSIRQLVDDLLATEDGKQNANDLLYGQLMFYANIGNYSDVVQVSEQIAADKLDREEKIGLYNALGTAYAAIGDDEQAGIYQRKAYQLAKE